MIAPEHIACPTKALKAICSGGNSTCITTLMQAGAEMDAGDSYMSPTMAVACKKGHVNVVKILLENGMSATMADEVREQENGTQREHNRQKRRAHMGTYWLTREGDRFL